MRIVINFFPDNLAGAHVNSLHEVTPLTHCQSTDIPANPAAIRPSPVTTIIEISQVMINTMHLLYMESELDPKLIVGGHA
jgi:hypothetical protein